MRYAAATPEKAGNIEYWQCEECKKFFSDAEGKTEITEADTVVNYVGPEYKAGDVNNDGSINARDISAIMKAMLGNVPAVYNEKAADFNNDGTINARDISAIMKYILNGGK